MGRKKIYIANGRMAALAIYGLNLVMMLIHCLFLTFFTLTHVHTMMAVNIFSILAYVGCFQLIRKKFLSLYAAATSFEIMAHMFMAVLCLGWDYGFQLYFLACIAVIFYTDYFSSKLSDSRVWGVFLSLASCVMYFVSYFYARFNPPVYVLEGKWDFGIQAANSFAVVVFIALCLGVLARTAANTEEELERQATHDRLTGLANRNYLLSQLDGLYEARQLKNYWLAIMDIDNFKSVNDIYGHNCGDYVLKSVADIISENSGGLTACRWGGEEFVLTGPEGVASGGQKMSRELLERIRGAVESGDFVYEGKRIRLTITIGLAGYAGEQTIDEWINVADQKLYVGKNSGKNRLVV